MAVLLNVEIIPMLSNLPKTKSNQIDHKATILPHDVTKSPITTGKLLTELHWQNHYNGATNLNVEHLFCFFLIPFEHMLCLSDFLKQLLG